MSERWNRWMKPLPPRWQAGVAIGLSIVAGLLCAVICHYVLYRIQLPSKPFIYVAF